MMTDRQPFKVGLLPPMWAEGATQPRWPTLLRYAQEAEALGFASLWVADDAMYRVGDEQLPIFGCIPTASALCACTQALTVGTLVANVHSRSAALIAKDADTLSAISGGRFVLGLGAGDDEAQHAALGLPWKERFAAYEEALQIITSLLRDGHVDFQGEHCSARHAELSPHTDPRPPVLVGGKGPRMLQRAVRFADMWNAYVAWSGDDPAGLIPLVDRACEQEGRDPQTLTRTVAISAAFDDAPMLIGHKLYASVNVRGDEQAVAAELWRLRDLGFEHVQVQTAPLDLRGMERLAHAVALLEDH